jgi:8-oxo-dGTP pyrophosphatase MutT (NUDIX family)
MRQEVVFATPWFSLLARLQDESKKAEPYYCLQTADFVSVVAVDEKKQLILVRQFRPAIGQTALELPGGHVDERQKPEDAARQELWEETGYRADSFELLGCLRPDVGRLTNRLWCFWASNPVADPAKQPEAGHEVVYCHGPLENIVSFGLDNCYSLSCIWLAMMRRKLLMND